MTTRQYISGLVIPAIFLAGFTSAVSTHPVVVKHIANQYMVACITCAMLCAFIMLGWTGEFYLGRLAARRVAQRLARCKLTCADDVFQIEDRCSDHAPDSASAHPCAQERSW